MMILDRENDAEPVYLNWTDCPKYRTVKLSQLIDPAQTIIKSKMYLRVTIDVPISFEEANFIRETFIPQYNLRELMLIPEKVEVDSNVDPIDLTFESVDTIVLNQIEAIDSDTIDKRMLMEIYRDLGRNL